MDVINMARPDTHHQAYLKISFCDLDSSQCVWAFAPMPQLTNWSICCVQVCAQVKFTKLIENECKSTETYICYASDGGGIMFSGHMSVRPLFVH